MNTTTLRLPPKPTTRNVNPIYGRVIGRDLQHGRDIHEGRHIRLRTDGETAKEFGQRLLGQLIRGDLVKIQIEGATLTETVHYNDGTLLTAGAITFHISEAGLVGMGGQAFLTI